MKKIFTTLALVAAIAPAFCQSPLVLTQANFPIATDSISSINVSSLITVPALGNNMTWDYSTVNISNATQYTYAYPAVSNDPFFTTAQFSGLAYYKALNTQFGYNYDSYFANTADAAVDLGLQVTPLNVSLVSITGNSADSLIILPTREYYPSDPRVIVKFPATINSAWSSTIRHVVHMRLTVTAAGVINAPMEHVFYVNRRDTVIGWGTLTLPAGSGTTGAVSVLRERASGSTLDSFYVNGSPASQTLTSAFGLTQGARTSTSFRENFYAAGSWAAPLFINYDSTFTTPSSAYISKNKSIANGISSIQADAASYAYPDPMNGNTFSIMLPASAEVTAVSIQDISGRVVDHLSAVSNGGIVHVQTTQPLAEGMYIYNVLGTDGQVVAKGKIISGK